MKFKNTLTRGHDYWKPLKSQDKIVVESLQSHKYKREFKKWMTP